MVSQRANPEPAGTIDGFWV